MAVDLSTTYLGLSLKNPLVAAASPMTGKVENLRKLEDAGIAAVVLPSLFEEQIEHEAAELGRLEDMGAESFAEAHGYFPPMHAYNTGTEEYLELIAGAKKALGVPVIGSLNGSSTGGWVSYARKMEEAGVDALELNVYLLAADPTLSGEQVEARYLELVGAVKRAISVPLAVKVGPYFSSIGNMMTRLADAGADGLVMFNRFLQPDIDLEGLQVVPNLELSTPFEMRLPLRWIAILRGHLKASLAATTGATQAGDVLKLLLAGADVVQLATAVLRHGPDHVKAVLTEMQRWLGDNEYSSVEQLKGSMSQQHYDDPAAFERANYMKALISYTGPFI